MSSVQDLYNVWNDYLDIVTGRGNMMKLSELLQPIANNDVQVLEKKDSEYGSSWKKRGGVGAFMMLARKWDRLETQVTRPGLDSKYDVFDAIEQDEGTTEPPVGKAIAKNPVSESTLESIRDLRRYLLLLEGEIANRRRVTNYGTGPGPSSTKEEQV